MQKRAPHPPFNTVKKSGCLEPTQNRKAPPYFQRGAYYFFNVLLIYDSFAAYFIVFDFKFPALFL